MASFCAFRFPSFKMEKQLRTVRFLKLKLKKITLLEAHLIFLPGSTRYRHSGKKYFVFIILHENKNSVCLIIVTEKLAVFNEGYCYCDLCQLNLAFHCEFR